MGYTTHTLGPNSSVILRKKDMFKYDLELGIALAHLILKVYLISEMRMSAALMIQTESWDENPSPKNQATKLVTRQFLSTHEASTVFASLTDEGVFLPVPP